jgi:carotenoid 1,2-hydratase
MTEHGESHVHREGNSLTIGKSRLVWDGTRLTVHIDETSTPFGRKIRGTVTIDVEGLGNTTFLIDDKQRHRWRPLAPLSRMTVDLQEPDLSWSGDSYLDSNYGDEPLEDGFTFWDWSRTIIDRERTAILYNTDMVSGHSCLSALLVDKKGDLQEIDSPPQANLPRTPIWRIKRRTRADAGSSPRIVKTFEDTPFYSRSVIETDLFGARRHAIHESLSGPRLRLPIVQFMLPYRMPRKE